MWKKLPKPFKFIICFLVISGLLVVLWKVFAIPYLYLLVGIAKPIWSIFDYPVQLVIKDKILRFVYIKITSEPISFSVYQVDEIYLNIVLIGALFGATWLTIQKKILRSALLSFGILFVIHEFVLYAYSYTNIWEYIGSEDYKIQEMVIQSVYQFFSKSKSNYLEHFLFHWNAWGWDVIPLILWLGSIYKFIPSRIHSVK